MHKIILLLLLVNCITLSATTYNFVPLEAEMGINMVQTVLRDHRGYLWIGNQKVGLTRHNGIELKTYVFDSSDNTSISGDAIKCIFEDSKKQLWIGTEAGLNKYVPEKDIFIRYYFERNKKTFISSNFINAIVESPDSNLWVLTQNGMFEYDRASDSFEVHRIVGQDVYNNFSCLDWDNKNRMWCGVIEKDGLYLFTPKENIFQYYNKSHTQKDVIGHKNLIIDKKNRFWYGHRGVGLSRFHPKSGEYYSYPSDTLSRGTNGKFIYDLTEADNENLYIGIDQGGINVLNRETNEFTYITNKTPLHGKIGSDGIVCIHIDYEGIIWVGTSRGGVSYHNDKEYKFNTHTSIPLTKVEDNQNSYFPSYGLNSVFCEDSKGNIWIGTDGGGINIFNRETKTFKIIGESFPSFSKVVRSINEDAQGNIWITPWEGNVLKYNPYKKIYTIEEFELPNLLKLNENAFWSMKIDSKQRFWVAHAFGEIALYDKNKNFINQFYVGDSVIHTNCKIYEHKDSKVFITSRKGIYYFNELDSALYPIVKINNIVSMDFGDDNEIWFITENGGCLVVLLQEKI